MHVVLNDLVVREHFPSRRIERNHRIGVEIVAVPSLEVEIGRRIS